MTTEEKKSLEAWLEKSIAQVRAAIVAGISVSGGGSIATDALTVELQFEVVGKQANV